MKLEPKLIKFGNICGMVEQLANCADLPNLIFYFMAECSDYLACSCP